MTSDQHGRQVQFVTSKSKFLSEWFEDRLDLLRNEDRWRDARALVKEFFVADPEKL